ncbi:unnamed protein product, partial [Ectocarpus fasciculatus]
GARRRRHRQAERAVRGALPVAGVRAWPAGPGHYEGRVGPPDVPSDPVRAGAPRERDCSRH